MDLTSPRNDRETLAAFLNGETAQVYARRFGDGDGRVLFLPEEGKPAFVAEHGDRFACIIPGCALRLIVVGATQKRHHFRHEPGQLSAGHGVESVMHQQAKALIHQWALDQGAMATVEKVLEGGSRRPDVFIDAFPATKSGSVAVEVQYSPLAIESTGTSIGFAERHGWYTDRHIPGVWLLGHLGAQMRPTSGGEALAGFDNRVELSNLHRRIAAAGMPVVWINPIEATVATAVVAGDDPARLTGDWRDRWWERLDTVGERLPDGGDLSAHLRIDPLADCRLDPSRGIVTPTMDRLAGQRAELTARAERARAAATAKRRGHEQREAARAAAENAAAQRSNDEREARRAKAIKIKAQRAADWPRHPDRAQMLHQCGGETPDFIATELPSDDNIRAHHEHWHWVVYRELVHGQVGEVHNAKAFWASIRGSFYTNPNWRWVNKAVLDYMHQLREAGLVDFAQDWNGFVPTVTIMADINGSTVYSPTSASPPPSAPSPPDARRAVTRTATPATEPLPRPRAAPRRLPPKSTRSVQPAWKLAVDAYLRNAAPGTDVTVVDLMDRTGDALLGVHLGRLLDHLRQHETDGRLLPRTDANARTVWTVQP